MPLSELHPDAMARQLGFSRKLGHPISLAELLDFAVIRYWENRPDRRKP